MEKSVSYNDFVKTVNKLTDILRTYKSKIDSLENRVQDLEQELINPWKMPFD